MYFEGIVAAPICPPGYAYAYITDSCGFQQNVQKEIVYTIKASVWMRQLNSLCFAAGKWNVWKQN